MAATWQPKVFPTQVPSGFRATRVLRSNGSTCPNSPDGYTAGGRRQPGERPILYDAFDEDRGGTPHRALDITCAEGSLIVATNDGVVPTTVATSSGQLPGAGTSPRGGNYVFVREDSGFTVYHAHMQYPALVRPGERVSANQVLGYCGRTGNAAGGCPHDHFAVTDPTGQKINPIHALKPLYEAGGWKRASGQKWFWITLGVGIAGFFTWRALAPRRR